MGAVSKLQPQNTRPPARHSGVRQRTPLRHRHGLLERTPLVDVLTMVLDAKVNATLCLTEADGTEHAVHLHRGIPCKVRTGIRVAPLDAVLRLMGHDLDHVFARTIDLATNGMRLHGELLVREGHIDRVTLHRALRFQVTLKMCHLLRLPGSTRYDISFDTRVLADYGGAELMPVAPLALIAQGCRLRGDDEHARARVARHAGGRLAIHPYANVAAMQLRSQELAIVDALRDHPCSIDTLLAARVADEATTITVVGLLVLTRSLDSDDDPPVGRGLVGVPTVIRRQSGAHPRVVAKPVSKSAVPARFPTEREIDARANEVKQASPYTVLGVPTDATQSVIESAYMQAMFQWHPDRLPVHLKHRRPTAERICAGINAAFNRLRDPVARRSVPVSHADTEQVESIASAAELLERARVQLRKRQLPEAEQLLDAALEADEELLTAVALRAWVRAERLGTHPNLERGETSEQYVAQLDALDGVLTRDPKFIEGRYYRGQLLKRSGYVAEALRDFQVILTLNPRHLDAKRELRLYNLREERRKANKGFMRRLMSRTPAWPLRHRPRGRR